MNYYISDLHFSHKNILQFDQRPWDNLDDMKQALINNWNSVATNADHVYHMGDFCWGKTPEWIEILKQLNGNIHICAGNHDVGNSKELKKYIVDYFEYKEVKDGDFTVILSHYPMLFYKHDGSPNHVMICGHLHNTKEWEQMKQMVAWGRKNYVQFPDNRFQIIPVEACKPYMLYTPRTLEYLLNCLDTGKIYGI